MFDPTRSIGCRSNLSAQEPAMTQDYFIGDPQ